MQIKTSNISLGLYENGSVLLERPMFEEYRKLFEQIPMITSDVELDMGVGDDESTPLHLLSE